MSSSGFEIEDLFATVDLQQFTLEQLSENAALLPVFNKICSELKQRYGASELVAQKMTLHGFNLSGGLIESCEELADYLGFTESQSAIAQQYETLYQEAGILDQEPPKVDLLGQLLEMMAVEFDHHSGDVSYCHTQNSDAFSFLNTLSF